MAFTAFGMKNCLVRSPMYASSFSSLRSTSKARYARIQPFRSFSRGRPLWEKKYTEDHEWVELSKNGKIGTVGITTYAAKQLGDVVYVELPALDETLRKGDSMGAVESVKSASDILIPMSGRIVEANSILEEKPAGINKDPEGDGWIAKIEIEDGEELTNLMDAKAYQSFTEDSGSE